MKRPEEQTAPRAIRQDKGPINLGVVLAQARLLLSNQQGVAIMMLFSTIAILTALLATFTFETNINKFKVYNAQDKIQARLNAEAGLKLALARLKLYKEAINALEKNKDVKQYVPTEALNQIWSMPLYFPIKLPPRTNIVVRKAVEEFEKENVLKGELMLDIMNASQLININFLRLTQEPKEGEPTPPPGEDEDKPDAEFQVENQLLNLLTLKIEEKKENDEAFNDRYGDVSPKYLVESLKYFVSDPGTVEGEYVAELESAYLNRTPPMKLKHAPLSSLSEIHLIEGWDDQLLDLIRDSITVHGNLNIDLNKITKSGLRLLFPSLQEEQLQEFFQFRDDPNAPVVFNTVQDFKNYIVGTARFMSEGEFDERLKNFEKAGIQFGTTSTLFKVISKGSYERASYTITAYVSLDPKPKPAPPKTNEGDNEGETDQEFGPEGLPTPTPNTTPGATATPTPPPLEYLEPKIVEILAN